MPSTPPPAVTGGVVYFGSRDRRLYALSAANGGLLWRFAAGDAISSSPAVADGAVYFGSSDGYIYALEATDGTQSWRYRTGGGVFSLPRGR